MKKSYTIITKANPHFYHMSFTHKNIDSRIHVRAQLFVWEMKYCCFIKPGRPVLLQLTLSYIIFCRPDRISSA